MGRRVGSSVGRAPSPGGPPGYANGSGNWTHFDKSVNAVYFGFVATAILVFMFLVMAVFERILAPNSPPPAVASGGGDGRRRGGGRGGEFSPKVDCPEPEPEVSVSPKEVFVLMPGNTVPAFIAHPAPMPCPAERVSWHPNQHSFNIEAPSTSNPD